MKTLIHIFLFIGIISLFSCNTKVTECNITTNFICYTAKPSHIILNLVISKSPSNEPVRVKLYLGDADTGELIDQFTTFNTHESYYLQEGEKYSVTAEYTLANSKTLLVVNADNLKAIYCESDDTKCYDWDYQESLDLTLIDIE